ncbi:type I restriction-modification system subunit M [Hymenobacter metallicola]|uniref:site-specific DNA-methyltransferase (adenine-specific) n=1 Tax=Hymenobacter metallicola TaxID=2563114 RepID=A0A4Z0PT75_9BACT|nr:class I SAM-dependent DNA methyltransferase [Hymenobacter metallicola]TGE20888.1 SAM-dependent DNA methyltransferase [Hymenobacter metallicola]
MAEQRPNIDFLYRITNDVLWNTFKKNEIGDVMLPFVVLRRLDCMLDSTRDAVVARYKEFEGRIAPEKLGPILEKAAGQKFYNSSPYSLKLLAQDAANVELNFRHYVNGFSPNVVDILDNYQLDKVVARLVKNGLLYQLIVEISKEDLTMAKVSNHDMGYVFEELIRIANEQSNETAGEHFTPREVIRLLASIIFSTEKEELKQPGIIRTIYDLACGTGGMLTLSKDYVLKHINKEADIRIYGQEINEQSYAIAKSDLLITGENPNNIRHGNSFTEDKFSDKRFNYMLANPPYGVSWKRDELFIKHEALSPHGRFGAGLPRSSDGQFLFIQHLVSKMEPRGSRIGIVTNGSPLFSGGAGSGESEIRRWLIQEDLLEAIVALPSEIFFNTGIYTYLWILSNKKPAERRGMVQLINAVDEYVPMRPSLNNKRKKISDEQIAKITALYTAFEEGPQVKIYPNDFFGYYEVVIEQPERNARGQVVLDKKTGRAKPDKKKRDYENVPLSEDLHAYFEREVQPHVPDAFMDLGQTRIGYEINFTKYFHQYKKPDTSADLKKLIISLESKIDGLLQEILAD